MDAVTASYHRCRAQGDFVDTFYEIFLGKSPEIAKKFAHTDFKHQKLMLRESLLEMLCFEMGMAGAKDEIERLGHRHYRLRISPDMYVMWLDALCEAIAKHDPQFTPELEQQWRDAMRPGIELMIASTAPQSDDV